jgi:cyclophilin family peptidyl-prolyl cis-trans isomerase
MLIRAAVAFWLVWAATNGLRADGGEEPAGGGLEMLGLEIRPLRESFTPNGPMWMRFTVTNHSDEPVDIPTEYAAAPEDGLTLPLELVVGMPASPALFVTYQDEPPVAIAAASSTSKAENGPRPLRLAPHGSLGVDVDFATLYRPARYAGTYRLEWRPCGGKVRAAQAQYRVDTRKAAILVTDYGKITFAMLYDESPKNVENFLELVRTGFYNGKTIHRIIPNMLLQGGDPKGDGTGIRPDGRLVPAEFHDHPFSLGTLAMARKPDDPNSASAQFLVTLGRVPELDREYTVIGQASDEESFRTLQTLGTLRTGKKHRPIKPVTIRSINLVDVLEDTPAAGSREVGVTNRISAPPSGRP